MMVSNIHTNASSAQVIWDSINWDHIETRVKQLQMRIAKVIREGKHRKAVSIKRHIKL